MVRLFFLFLIMWIAGVLKAAEPPVIVLEGTYYQMGYRHGMQLRSQIQKNLERFRPLLVKFPEGTDEVFSELTTFIPQGLIEEMQGIADGSGVEFAEILHLNLIPELFHCTGFTVKEEWTADKSLYHVRVLDYAAGKGLQDTAVILVYRPSGKIPFVNIAYAGFVGSVTGMNAQKIAIGEIGGKGYGSYSGMPMAFLLREILESASSLADVVHILQTTPRTCEYYYVFSDGKAQDALGVYATAKQLKIFHEGTSYGLFATASESEHDKFVCVNANLETYPFQNVIKNEKGEILSLFFRQPEKCVAITGFSPPRRYNLLMTLLHKDKGCIDVEKLKEIIRPLCLQSNLHNVIFQPEKGMFWISNAGPSGEQAADEPYYSYSLDILMAAVGKK